MQISSENLYCILIIQNNEILVNMMYVELNEEVCGAFIDDGGSRVFLDNGGDIMSFLIDEYLNIKRVFLE